MSSMRCIICSNRIPFIPVGSGRVTCSPACHEAFVAQEEKRCGKFKNVIRRHTGQAFKVPTRDIIEKGIREEDLDSYPKWED